MSAAGCSYEDFLKGINSLNLIHHGWRHIVHAPDFLFIVGASGIS